MLKAYKTIYIKCVHSGFVKYSFHYVCICYLKSKSIHKQMTMQFSFPIASCLCSSTADLLDFLLPDHTNLNCG